MGNYLNHYLDYQVWQKVTLTEGITAAQRRKMESINRKIVSVLTGGIGGLPSDFVTVVYEGGFTMGIDAEGRGHS